MKKKSNPFGPMDRLPVSAMQILQKSGNLFHWDSGVTNIIGVKDSLKADVKALKVTEVDVEARYEKTHDVLLFWASKIPGFKDGIIRWKNIFVSLESDHTEYKIDIVNIQDRHTEISADLTKVTSNVNALKGKYTKIEARVTNIEDHKGDWTKAFKDF